MVNGPQMLRDWRTAQGMTIPAAAAALRVKEDTFSAWIAGRRKPGRESAVALLHVAGIPIDARWGPPVAGDRDEATGVCA